VKLSFKSNRESEMKVVQTIVLFLAISEVTATQSLVQYNYQNPKLESLIARVMTELNARDSSTHDVALLHQLISPYYNHFINDICLFVLRSVPKENVVIKSSMRNVLKNKNLRKADVIITVTDDSDSVSEACEVELSGYQLSSGVPNKESCH
jgi:hypothetical protein